MKTRNQSHRLSLKRLHTQYLTVKNCLITDIAQELQTKFDLNWNGSASESKIHLLRQLKKATVATLGQCRLDLATAAGILGLTRSATIVEREGISLVVEAQPAMKKKYLYY